MQINNTSLLSFFSPLLYNGLQEFMLTGAEESDVTGEGKGEGGARPVDSET
jgi:hypothetical protein